MHIAITSGDFNGHEMFVVVSSTGLGPENYIAKSGYNLIELVQFLLDEFVQSNGELPQYITVSRYFRFDAFLSFFHNYFTYFVS